VSSIGIPVNAANAALSALYGLAISDGNIAPFEQSMLDAASKALGVDSPTTTITPEALADAVPDPIHRLRLVQALELMALLDGEVVSAEIQFVDSIMQVLGVSDPRIHNLRQIRCRNLRMLQLDLMRRSPMAGMAKEVWNTKGLGELWRFATSSYGWSQNPDLADKYNQLRLLPADSFGRGYWAHMTERGFQFPGESKGFPEELVRHDLVHVLSGYGTDVAGECQNTAFIAGFLKEDPFSYLFMIAVHCHMDIEVFPDDPSQAAMALDPALVIPALRRGMQVNRDLYSLEWDFWLDFPRPIDEVRAEFGVI
jgi:uncharacterized tellurite resistance protein B-like protein